MKTLTATPSSAKALAAAGAGETVTLRMSVTAPEGAILTAIDDCVYACDVLTGEVTDVLPPVAEGERVAVACPDCEGEGFLETDPPLYPCHTCKMRGTLLATVTAAPEPEAWCEECGRQGWQCPSCGSEGDGLPPEECPCNTAPGLVDDTVSVGGVRPPGYTCPANYDLGHSCSGRPLLLGGCPDCNGKPDQCRWRVEVRREGDA